MMSNNGSSTSGTAAGTSSVPYTLDDCPTNIFQIAELNGLKWCCFTGHHQPLQSTSSEQGEDPPDPILRAYQECLESNMLCTWRRRPPTASVQNAYEKPIPKVDAQKELWLFWYTAEEPKLIEEFKSRGMSVQTHSESADTDAPRVEFEYETRTLFFKALNGAIERRLLREGFVRFGRWFCRPLELSTVSADDRRAIPRFTNAIRFHYFLHRDLVCASIVVQRQPTILRLARAHLEEAERAQPVVLGPWSIRAKLVPGQQQSVLRQMDGKSEGPSLLPSTSSSITPQSAGTAADDSQQKEQELLDKHWAEWKRIYPGLNSSKLLGSPGSRQSPGSSRRSGGQSTKPTKTPSSAALPKMVLIQLNGQNMLYPTAFVGILADELLPPKPVKKPSVDDIFDLPSQQASSVVGQVEEMGDLVNPQSTLSKRTAGRTYKRESTGVQAARTSFGYACLRCRKTGTGDSQSDGRSMDSTFPEQQKPADSMAEYSYDYMRREFCYCRICPPLGRIAGQQQEQRDQAQTSSSIAPPSAHSNHSSHTAGTSPYPIAFHAQQDETQVEAAIKPPQRPSTSSSHKSKPKTSKSHAESNGSRKWVSANGRQQHQQQAVVTGISSSKDQWDSLGQLGGVYRRRTVEQHQKQQKQAVERSAGQSQHTLNNPPHAQHQQQINPITTDQERERNPSQLPHTQSHALDTGQSELERMIMGDDDDEVEQLRTFLPTPTKEDPLGLLQRRRSGERLKWRKRKRKWQSVNRKRAKRVEWPSLERLDSLCSAFVNEDSSLFTQDPCSSLPAMPTTSSSTREVQPQRPQQSLLMKLLLSPNAAIVDEEHQVQAVPGQQQHLQAVLGEQQPTPAAFRDDYLMPSTSELVEERMDEYAVTPPALLNTGEEPTMEEQSATTAHYGEDEEPHEQMDVEESGRGFEDLHTKEPNSPTPSQDSTTMQMLLHQQQQHTPQHHILSPPASNERVETINAGGSTSMVGLVGTSALQYGGIGAIAGVVGAAGIATQACSASLIAASANAALLQESLSRIYPTPPTPMQQFSPQNMLLLHHHQHHPQQQQPLTEQGLLSAICYFADQFEQMPREEPLYDAAGSKKAHAREFCLQHLATSGSFGGGKQHNNNDRYQQHLDAAHCADCAGIKADGEQDRVRAHKAKRPCCERELDKLTHNNNNNTFPQMPSTSSSTLVAIQLHATAQRRTPADTSLEMRLQKTEWERFRLFMDEFGGEHPGPQQWAPPFWPPQMPPSAFSGEQPHPFPFGPQFRGVPATQPMGGGGIFPGPGPGIFPPNMFTPGMPSPQQQHFLARQFSMSELGQRAAGLAQLRSPQTPANATPLSRGMSQQQLLQGLGTPGAMQSPNPLQMLHREQQQRSHSQLAMVKTPQNLELAERQPQLVQLKLAKGSLFTLLIQDTIADLHYDIVFDACPLCCCNSNIRSFELGFYITGPVKLLLHCDQLQQRQRQQQGGSQQSLLLSKQWSGFRVPTTELQKCICGFSAVRHRFLCSQGSGLFPDDIAEASGHIYDQQRNNRMQQQQLKRLIHFNPANIVHCQLIDLLRHLAISQDIFGTLNFRVNFPMVAPNPGIDGNYISNSMMSSNYVLSPIDSVELCALVNGLFANVCGTAQQNGVIEAPTEESTLHPWGYQYADAVGEPRDTECLGIFEELRETLREPGAALLIPGYSNGRPPMEQFTLRAFARAKSGAAATAAASAAAIGAGKDEENGRAEPIPSVVVMSAVEKEPVMVSPHLVRLWEQLELMPAEQPKDVLYMAVVPDVNVLAEKCKVFMEELSSIYERRCRLGSHIRLGTKEAPRDAILRVGRTLNPNASTGQTQLHHSLQAIFHQFGINPHAFGADIQRLSIYAEQCVQELTQFFCANDAIFERRAYLESAYRHLQQSQGTSLASPPDASAMPPPAMPTNALLTGPASATAGAGSAPQHDGNMTGPASASNQHTSPLSIPGLQHQQSPSGGSGPNSVPILPATSSAMETGVAGQMRVGDSAEEQAKRDDKLAKEMREQVDLLLAKEPPQLPHTIVVYLVNPFGQQFGGSNATEQQQHQLSASAFGAEQFGTVATAALLMAWNEFLSTLQPKRRAQLQLELLPLRNIYDYTSFMGVGQQVQVEMGSSRERVSAWDALKRMAFSVYAQPRLLRPHVAMGALSKSMTRFGTAERMKEIFQQIGESPLLIKQNCSPFLLANRSLNFSQPPSHGSTGTGGSKLQLLNTEEHVLLLAYCLLPGADWLCAAVTDERGALLDTTLINLAPAPGIPPAEPGKEWRHKQRHSQIADALHRLWMFAQSVILGQEVHQWRLVVTRMGKLGHGEFKLWNELLSKKNLRAYNASLKSGGRAVGADTSAGSDVLTTASHNCSACANSSGWQETPALLSACLVSTEPEPHLRVFGSSAAISATDYQNGNTGVNAGSVGISGGAQPMAGTNLGKMGGNKGTGRQSAQQTQQWAQQQALLQMAPEDRSLTHIVVFPTILNVSCQQQEEIHGPIDDELDFLNFESGADEMEMFNNLDLDEGIRNEEEAPIDNQPMAIGFTISTAPVSPSPNNNHSDGLANSFWSNCPPAARQRRLAHLKSSLHINSTNLLQSDEYQQQAAGGATRERAGTATAQSGVGGGASSAAELLTPHPLDMGNTDEVLRYVLETQNALSWLCLDPVTGNRLSCLPIHMQAILRLARSVDRFFGTTGGQQHP